MGFGQHATASQRNKDKGYPAGTKVLKVGRMTQAEIMDGVNHATIIKTEKSAHNEVTLTYANDTVVCRLRRTNIVTITKDGVVLVKTGGWNTLTTRRHAMNFLKRQGFQISMRGDKKRGGNVLAVPGDGKSKQEVVFKQWAIFNLRGGYLTALGTKADTVTDLEVSA